LFHVLIIHAHLAETLAKCHRHAQSYRERAAWQDHIFVIKLCARKAAREKE
jgi:hypothetical protein